MKNIRLFILAIVTTWLSADLLTAKEPCCRWLGCPVPDCIGKWCCDDYDAKCLPCVDVSFCVGCDNYCGKRIPCTCVPLCLQCDDYCKKCLPRACTPPLLHNLQCGPPPNCRCAHCCPMSTRKSGELPCAKAQTDTTNQEQESGCPELTLGDQSLVSHPEQSDRLLSARSRSGRDDRFVVVREVSHEAAQASIPLAMSENTTKPTGEFGRDPKKAENASAPSEPGSAVAEKQAASLRSFLQSLRR